MHSSLFLSPLGFHRTSGSFCGENRKVKETVNCAVSSLFKSVSLLFTILTYKRFMITYTNNAVTLQVSSTDPTQHLISTTVTPDDGSLRAETCVGF